MKSHTCYGSTSGKPLTYYFYEFEAETAAEYIKTQFDNELGPYECKKCGYWHLSPKERMTPSTKCNWCTAADGEHKNSYRSKKDARVRADISYEEKGIDLKVYKCRYGEGWHLTKRF